MLLIDKKFVGKKQLFIDTSPPLSLILALFKNQGFDKLR